MGLYPTLIGLVVLTVAGVFAGIRLAEVHSISRRVLPFSGGLLVGIAMFWILPEIAEQLGWIGGSGGVVAGFALLWLIDRYVYPVCPTCSHTHHHEDCSRSLHGFAAPLLIAAGVHSFFDGWSLAVSQQKGYESLKAAFLVGIGVHKLPEGLALGALLMAALGVEWKALAGGAAAQLMMVAGGSLAVVVAPHLTANWTVGLLSVAAGAFLYLGYHAIDAEYQRRGVATAMVPALSGVVGAAVLRVVVPGA
ncbi:MAG TPA: ZIP family metal transporter [Bryobacteraceae bacterium]|nr:ZIP family metal transporter [Bryobacteraceae bacterium]